MQITRLDPVFSVSPQLHPSDLARVKAAGYRAIVDNRPDWEDADQPTAAELRIEAARLGLRFAFIPISPGHMSDDDARALSRAVAEAGGPVLAFCRTGARSTRLWQRSRELGGIG